MNYPFLKNISGTLLILFSAGWLTHYLSLFYKYHFTQTLFLVIIPDWMLLLSIAIGIAGIALGIKIMKSKISIGLAGVYSVTLFVGSVLIESWVIS